MVALYGRLKTIENCKTVSSKKEVVVAYRRCSFTRGSIFGVLGGWLLMGGGHCRMSRSDCIKVNYGNNDVQTIYFLFFNIQPFSSMNHTRCFVTFECYMYMVLFMGIFS